MARTHIIGRAAPYLRPLAATLAILILILVSIRSFDFRNIGFANNPTGVGMKVSAAALFGFIWWRIKVSRSLWAPVIVSVAMLISLLWIVPTSFRQARILASNSDPADFSDWADAIPPTSSVLVAPARDVGSFVWFTLRRPNYLALDQSSGVVFSRLTALEIRRRSEMLLALTEPAWKILSGNRRGVDISPAKFPTHPLTTQTLIQVCSDPLLGFVISPENAGFTPLRHTKEGSWKDWNLYDCNRVRSNSTT